MVPPSRPFGLTLIALLDFSGGALCLLSSAYTLYYLLPYWTAFSVAGSAAIGLAAIYESYLTLKGRRPGWVLGIVLASFMVIYVAASAFIGFAGYWGGYIQPLFPPPAGILLLFPQGVWQMVYLVFLEGVIIVYLYSKPVRAYFSRPASMTPLPTE